MIKDFHIRTVHLDIIKVIYSPMNAQVIVLKTILKFTHINKDLLIYASGVPRNFFRGAVQQIQLRTNDRENGDLGAVAT
jgi:hypothetical protein